MFESIDGATKRAAERDPSPVAARVSQEAADAYERSRIGGLFFVVVWMLMCVTAGQHGLREWAIGLGFLALAGSRLLVGAALRRAPRPHGGHLAATLTIMFVTMLAWGLATAFALSHADYAATPTVILFATSAFTTAFVHSYPMRVWPALAGVAAGYAPPWVALLLSDRPGTVPIATGVAIHFAYLVLAARRAHYEYHRSIDLEHELRAQRDAFSRRSRIDLLTGLANRGEFGERLDAAVVAARASKSPLSLLLIDLDHFKAINDERGHAIGDACLAAVAARLRGVFDAGTALSARLGGEEFGVLLPDCDIAVARARAELFRVELASRPIACGELDVPVTASIGVGAFDPEVHADPDAVYRAVDAALYRAKHDGRNRVVQLGAARASLLRAVPRPGED
ncbi:MAG TPA: GGDEF domain-containing protein [Candidatus Saccharimonadia bacterium]|nr:GGDEF domain-containing protein [Candidatus Saccharimonadia bacterium]